ncbi:hypothetical protein BDP55DRAFT_682943 [Colletotrichum godetiae]|uniref:Uncharacterized protein n=1 Tax=Colletotrichum godetiae TaxID=1209918 RepID=A0AAJ0AC81_9PEZI|nr:uncharacterized protein BDP55DRAFT_682943 [Colletotrichum godetiae]KAK1658300.1 hypothetical protein BDP55DRAFT_682943 [Colletotrichum godetiae]
MSSKYREPFRSMQLPTSWADPKGVCESREPRDESRLSKTDSNPPRASSLDSRSPDPQPDTTSSY